MVSGGGGGGKKIPPGGPPATPPHRVPTQPNTGKATSTPPAKPVVVESKPPPPETSDKQPAAPRPPGDAFDNAFKTVATDIHKLDEAFASSTATASGIESLVRMLDQARVHLAAEHRVLKQQAQHIVEMLVNGGFSPAQLEQARKELQELRKKMALLRKRLSHLQRRLKSAFAAAGKTGDANFAKMLGAQLDKLKKLGPGLARAMLALQTIEQAYGTFADGSAPILRLHVGEAGPKAAEKLGRALAALAPGAAVARVTLGLLRDGPAAAPPQLPAATLASLERHELLDGTLALSDALYGLDVPEREAPAKEAKAAPPAKASDAVPAGHTPSKPIKAPRGPTKG